MMTTSTGSDFDQFWAAYPKKRSKADARKAFAQAMKITTLTTILSALEWQRHQPGWLKDGGQYVPYPASWLRDEAWDDEPFHAPQVSERTIRNLKAIYEH